jgi:hypothetical protein
LRVPTYHPDAQQECQEALDLGGREVKRCFGMMLQRHLRITDGSEPLAKAELLPATGVSGKPWYEVTYACGVFSMVTAVYEVSGPDVTLLAIDARQGLSRVGLAGSSPDARARAWSRSS